MELTLPPISERVEPLRPGHVIVPESNRRWVTDLTTTWTAQEGTVALVPVERSLEEAVEQWLDVYNGIRPHQALDGMTPAEKRAENLGIELNQAG